MTSALSPLRVLLDTNVWSALAREGSERELDELTERHACRLVIPPSVLLEVLKTPHVVSRDRIVRLIAIGPRRQRLRTEAHLQSLEYVDVIRRRRPEMIRGVPDTGTVASLEAFWLKKFYRRALEDSETAHRLALQVDDVVDELLPTQNDNRRSVVESGLVETDLTMLQAFAVNPQQALDWGGWDGGHVAMWRLLLRDHLSHSLLTVRARGILGGPKDTFADWVGAYVDLSKLARDLPGFSRIWLEEAGAEEVLRSWLRWTLDAVQLRRRVTHGNPVDNQHAAYLPDCDVFMTRDKAFAAVLGEVSAAAPAPVGQVHLLRHEASRGVVHVLDKELDRVADSVASR